MGKPDFDLVGLRPARAAGVLFLHHNDDDSVSLSRTGGGSRRTALPARFSSLAREGGTVLQVVIFRESRVFGNGDAQAIQTRREKFGTADFRDMLDGQRPVPTGLSEQQVRKRLSIMEEREQQLTRNAATVGQRAKAAFRRENRAHGHEVWPDICASPYTARNIMS